MLAAGAAHKAECDSQRVPSVLQKLNQAASVEDVTAAELGACLGTQLTCEADSAELIGVDVTVVVLSCAVRVKAGGTVALAFDTVALVPTFQRFCAGCNEAFFFCINVIAGVDHDSLLLLFNLHDVSKELRNLDLELSCLG